MVSMIMVNGFTASFTLNMTEYTHLSGKSSQKEVWYQWKICHSLKNQVSGCWKGLNNTWATRTM